MIIKNFILLITEAILKYSAKNDFIGQKVPADDVHNSQDFAQRSFT